MNDLRLRGPDPQRSRLRATVAAIEREISRLPRQGTIDNGKSPPHALLSSWADLVRQLDLGPEPELRECPVCHYVGMRAATVCGHCWTKLEPPTEGVAEVG